MISRFLRCYKNSDISLSEASSEIYFLLDILFGISKKDILMGKLLSEDNEQKILEIIKKRILSGMPIQYIINQTFFMNEKFYVNENVLIPRDDTEILVQNAKSLIEKNGLKKILDIGTGSGIIAITLKKILDVEMTASDISEKALDVAKKNAMNKKTDIKFILSDLFENIDDTYDLIISNPPYIPIKEKKFLQDEVRLYEPEIALFSEDEKGIAFYKRIIAQASRYLKKNGFLIFEIGYNQAEIIKDIFMLHGYNNITIKKDVSNLNRIIYANL